MIKKVLQKTSSFLYRAYVMIDRLSRYQPLFKPYRVKSQLPESKFNIIHINGNFIVGGTSQLIVDIIERTSNSFSHKVIVPELPKPLPYQPLSIHEFSLMQMTKLYEFLKSEKPDLVHVHYWCRFDHRYESFTIWYQTVFKICEELQIKVIQNVNVPTSPYLSSSVVHNVFVSKYVINHYNNSILPSSVIYPGSDFSHFKNDDIKALPNDCIGMVYRLDRDKLNEKSIEVFISIVKKRPNTRCYIIGGGYFLEYYKERVASEHLQHNFIFTGVVSYKTLPDLYKKFSIFIAPVHDESFGQVAPFAMSMGLVVAGYDIGALSEILDSNETLVEYGNIDQLAEKVIDIMEHPEKRVQMGQVNKERVHKYFSVESMVSDYKDLYDRYLAIST